MDMPEGSSSRLAKIMKMHANYDYILAASDAYKSHLAEGFHYPTDKIVTLPLPRVEALEDPNLAESTRKKIVSAYPQLTERERKRFFIYQHSVREKMRVFKKLL